MDGVRHILLTGGAGQLGMALRARNWPEDVRLHAPARAELDLADSASIADFLATRRWSAIINAGAYTAVDAAEDDVATCWMVNASAPAQLAAHAAALGAPIIHISTGYVFDGAKEGAYVEEDAVAPLSVYGASKAAGEIAALAAHERATVLRTSWLVSPYGKNFVKAILARAHAGDPLRVVSDQFGNPSTAHDIAAIAAAMLAAQMEDAHTPSGVYHAVNHGVASWRDFASEIIAAATGLSERPHIAAIATADFPAKARRPANCALNCARLSGDYGLTARPWRDALRETLHAMAGPPA